MDQGCRANARHPYGRIRTMKGRSFFLLLLALLSFFWTDSARPLLAAAKKAKKAETLSTQKDLPQKYSRPAEAVKTFFTAFKDKDFDLAWQSLSAASKDQFVRSFAAGRKLSPVQVRDLFDKNKESVRLEF